MANPPLAPWQIEHIRKMQEELGAPQGVPDTEDDTMVEDIEGGLASVEPEIEPAVETEVSDLSVYSDAGVRAAMKERNKLAAERQKYYDDLTAKLTAQRAGPSFSERMFQLSAALAQPLSRRGLGGILANVTPVLAEQQKAQREGEVKRKDALSALAAAQLTQRENLAEQAVSTELQLAKLNRPKPARVVGNTVIGGIPSVIIQDADGTISTKPLGAENGAAPKSNIGEVSKRGGVDGYIDERGVWRALPQRQEKETFRPATPEEAAMYGAATGQISNLTGKFLPGVAPKPRTLSGGETKILTQAEDVLASADDTLTKLRRVMELNPKSLEGSLTGFRKQVGSLFSSDDPAYVATEEQDNTLQSMALSMLKSTFPGAVSDGERAALQALQGSSSLPRAARERIYRNAFAAAQTVAARARDRIGKTKEGYYTERTSAPKPAAGNVIRYDKSGNRI